MAAQLGSSTNAVTTFDSVYFITLYMKVLRLLPLNDGDARLKDASIPTLASQAAGADQILRIRFAESSLYHLFELWKPKETVQRLKQYYPVTESRQSLHLRAALHRWLSQLKAENILSNGLILRKTMFDDCKAQHFWEVLLEFALVVAQSDRATNSLTDLHPAVRQSLLQTGLVQTSLKQDQLLPMIIAYRSTLRTMLERREEMGNTFSALAQDLHDQERAVEQRSRSIVESQSYLDANNVSDAIVDRNMKQLDTHWPHDKAWLIGLGLCKHDGASTLDTARQPPIEETGDPSRRLTQILDERIATQVDRLVQRRAMKAELDQMMPRESRHQVLPAPNSSERYGIKPIQPDQTKVFSPRKSPRKSVWPSVRSSLSKEKESPPNRQDQSRIGANIKSEDSPGPGRSRRDTKTMFDAHVDEADAQIERISDRTHTSKSESFPNSRPDPALPKEDKSLQETIIDVEMNNDVLDSVGQGFRDSTSRTVMKFPQDLDPVSLMEEKANFTDIPVSIHRSQKNRPSFEESNGLPNLMDRTRQSILIASSKPSPRQLSRNAPSQTRTAYIRSPFATPDRRVDNQRGSTPPEELFSPDAGYDSVFKSRPKINNSPPISPLRKFEIDEEYEKV